jgi:hypothetical protein
MMLQMFWVELLLPLQDRSESNWEWVDHTAVASARDGEVGKRPCPCQWEQATGKTLMGVSKQEGIFEGTR